jgi:hypothetical protein
LRVQIKICGKVWDGSLNSCNGEQSAAQSAKLPELNIAVTVAAHIALSTTWRY